MANKSANQRAWSEITISPMRVRDDIIDLCADQIEPRFKRFLRKIMHPLMVLRLGLDSADQGFQWAKNGQINGSRFGRYSSFGHSTEFYGPVVVGDLTMLSTQVQVIGQDHQFDDVDTPMRLDFPKTPRPVTVIEADCWISSRVTIMEGVTIGRGSIIGAGAVVTKSIPPYSIALGVPARVVRKRFDAEQAKHHDQLLYGTEFGDLENGG